MSEKFRTASEIEVRYRQHMGSDRAIVAAMMQSTKGEDAWDFAFGLDDPAVSGRINYLMKSRHGTPFEHSALTLTVHAPAFVWWQWVRHRIGWSFNIESSRYGEMDPVYWVPRPDRPMIPTPDSKPSRPRYATLAETFARLDPTLSREDVEELAEDAHADEVRRDVESYGKADDEYRESIAADVAPEVARCKLPFGVYFAGAVTCNPRSIMAFLSVRTRDDAATFPSYPQAEIEEAARKVEAEFARLWPITHAAFQRNGRVGP